jgi:hypothetical protein
MIIALAGRLVDKANVTTVSFPLAMKDIVRKRIRDLFIIKWASMFDVNKLGCVPG